jgi:cytochrome bd quinol oxidase subunit 1 apoprotein (EC 1.10.3.-)
MLLTPSGFIAVLAGWYTTEIGRQPYVIYGLMRTEEALSAVSAGSVATSLIVFATVYLFIFIAGTYYLLKLLRKGPQPVGGGDAVIRRRSGLRVRCRFRKESVEMSS